MKQFLLMWFEKNQARFKVIDSLQVPDPTKYVPESSDSGFAAVTEITDFVKSVKAAQNSKNAKLN